MRKLCKGESYALLRTIRAAIIITKRSPATVGRFSRCAPHDGEEKRGIVQYLQPTAYGSKFITLILICFMMLFSDAQAQSAGERAAIGQNEITPLQIGDSVPPIIWKQRMPLFRDTVIVDTLSLSDFKDAEVLIIDFWPTWCSSCVATVKYLDSVFTARQYKNIKLVSICVYDSEDRLKAFVKRTNWNVPTLFDRSFLQTVLLSDYKEMYGQVIIKDGRLFAVPDKRTLKIENLDRLDKGEWDELTLINHVKRERRKK